MIIEKLKKSDLAKYKSLIDKCFDGSNDLEVYKNKYDENSKVVEIIVVKEGEDIIGSITFYKINLFTFSSQPALEIFNVCVDDRYRGKKVAKKMFQHVIRYAKSNGYKSMFLTCLDTAYDAHHLYESMGMVRANSVKYQLNL